MKHFFGITKKDIIDWFIILFFILLIATISSAQNTGITNVMSVFF